MSSTAEERWKRIKSKRLAKLTDKEVRELRAERLKRDGVTK